MSKRLLMIINQPCVLCEDTLEQWYVYRNDETGQESIECEPISHACEALRALIKERAMTPRENWLAAQKR